MKKLKPLWWLFVSVAWLVLLATQTQAAQVVQPTLAVVFADPQVIIPVNLRYTVTLPDTENSTGLGLRVHYNANTLERVSQTAYSSQLQPIGAISPDTQNLDGDLATDHYWVLAWVDINAAWPGAGQLPLNLFNSQFRTKAGFTGATTIRFSASATAQGTYFQTNPLIICAKPLVSLLATDALANEKAANTASFQVRLATPLPTVCGDLSIDYQVSGTAIAGSDYAALSGQVIVPAGSQQADIVLTPFADTQIEADESVSLSLQANSHYQLASEHQASVTLQDASVDALPTVLLTSAKLQVLEGTDASVKLTVARQAKDLSLALTVALQTAGSASVGKDYQALPNSLSIPAGQTQASLVVNLFNDTLQEQDETLKISLSAQAAYHLSELNSVDLLLLDDESRLNTDLPLNQAQTQQIPTLSEPMLLLLMVGFALLACTHPRLGQRKLGAKA